MSIAEKLTQIAENEQRVYDAGKKAEYDRFWDVFQNNGKRKDYLYGFAGIGWDDTTYCPKYSPITLSLNSQYMYAYSNITDTKVPIDVSNTVAPGNCTYMFAQAQSLVTVNKLIVSNTTRWNNNFSGCRALESLTIEGEVAYNGLDVQHSTKLNKASITSIINALSSTTSGLSVTLSKTAVNNAFGINVDDATTYPEGSEYYALRHSKDNWTINYL